ncbi:hypothetical protein KDL01_06415 [Actinospica durhamensis]|uniref:Uncharacterized protein n=1 Tax=Actinospica durhamensis TaxID=1508375 RepID=A0A941IP93_9ACTN|nr:hypothetical protein [Actinospica durhamensis]MBR7832887.1 hypothetical protein [Actinospica durhamensis]
MATQITVRVTGDLGLDDAEELLRELRQQTGVEWSEQKSPAEDDGHLTGGLVEILISAVVGKGVEMALDPVIDRVVDRVHQAIDRFRGTRFDPPATQVDLSSVDPDQAEPNPAAGDGAAGAEPLLEPEG